MSATQQSGYKPAGRERVGLVARKVAANLIAGVVDDKRSLEKLVDERNGLAAWRALIERDRALARAIATTALRHRGEIEQALMSMLERKPPQRARHLLHTLHAAAAQILFMAAPDSAAVDLAVTAIFEDGRTKRFASMANAVLRRLAREKVSLKLDQSARTVFPRWLADQLRTDHGRQTADAIASAVLHEPTIDITPSPALSGAQVAALAEHMAAQILACGSLRLTSETAVRDLAGYEIGTWWVQDAASAMPVRMLGEVRGLAVADLCAAPGGKTAQLAAAGAQVTAVDISASRLVRLRENLARLKLSAEIVEADILQWEPGARFDAVLLDAPCSSTGTIRRHPDVMWNKEAAEVEALAQLQEKLIVRAASFLRPGGTLVYANCSMLKREGEALLAKFVSGGIAAAGLKHLPLAPGEMPGIDGLINTQGALRTLPGDWPRPDMPRMGGLDGFFACRFTKASSQLRANSALPAGQLHDSIG